MSLQTEFEFALPKGFVDQHGTLHRNGVMRLATARDEIEPLRDPRVRDNDAYLTVIVLARVIVRLGDIDQVTTKIIEGLFTGDMAFLQELYDAVNYGDPSALLAAASEGFGDEATPQPAGGAEVPSSKPFPAQVPAGAAANGA